MRAVLACLTLACLTTSALAQGCPPDDGSAIAEVETINQVLLDGDYPVFLTTLEGYGIDATSVVDALTPMFPNGLSSCTTLLQREEVGTAAQSVVAFTDGGSNTLFFYWRSVQVSGQFFMLNMYVNSDQDKVFAKVF